MVFNFHMWHDLTTGFQNVKIQSGRESKMAASAINSKANESTFSPEWLKCFMYR